MFVEIFSICDAATDYSGRLNLLGAFEGIAAPAAPVIRDRCSIAVRLRFEVAETGPHTVEILFLDPEGQPISPRMNAKISAKVAAGRESSAHNLVLNINRLQLPVFGTYTIELRIDGERRSQLPLLVAKTQQRNRLRSSMEN